MQHLTCPSVVEHPIIMQVLPNKKLGVRHSGNWPSDAILGVEYRCLSKVFPIDDHGTITEYFSSEDALNDWMEKQKEWVKNTGFDFSIQYSIYEWGIGPEFRSRGYF